MAKPLTDNLRRDPDFLTAADRKTALRRKYVARRREMTREEVEEKSKAIRERVQALMRREGVRKVMAYVSVRNEVETR